MVYTSQQTQENYQTRLELPKLLDPTVLKAAKHIYRVYYEVHPYLDEQPSGVAIDRYTLRGKLIFSDRPILLPTECFVPLSQLEGDFY
ncbi:hypothetical protein BJP37_25375 [Moorena bouillonii PNG]|uniref:Uncharacterized protein n=1 Tax=Moorena bouillonii PNG TaxID=568701 RepID=A0A1U7N7D1_9CYAN|nr:hypothetical protein [Moorena bouillonii]NEQ84025.1 hypothetical protein [Moorena sp. SIO2I5]OLT61860.1 hypothetical protein BJP37_25375 [Moorena bouillonii PNG]